MEHDIKTQIDEKKDYTLHASIVVAAFILAGAWIYSTGLKVQGTASRNDGLGAGGESTPVSAFEEAVLPRNGVVLPLTWGDIGLKLVSVGAIDAEVLRSIYEARGEFTGEYEALLLGENNGKIKITEENAGYLLNLFWAFGLANKNPILESGEMQDPVYGGAGRFASTGGWSVARGNPMDHYSRHSFLTLTEGEQALVDRMSRGIYRPCCNNSTHFPDCNHGMAMLGLLELMAAQGVNEEDMWRAALTVNSYWFPDTYLTIASYVRNNGVEWENINPQEVLGANFSSASGYARIASLVAEPQGDRGGSGCGVDAGATTVPRRESGRCGI